MRPSICNRLIVIPVVLALAACGAVEPLTTNGKPDWSAVDREIRSEPIVRDVEHDPVDDFVMVTVADGTDVATATRLGCEVVLPRITEAGSVALFAIYDESGNIISSWIACE